MDIKLLVGSGHRIGTFAAPFLVGGLALNLWQPGWFSVGGPSPTALRAAMLLLVPGVVVWAWSVYLILARVPRHQLITTGPYRLVKHPLYTAVGLLVLPGLGLACDTWLGFVVGAAVYAGCRRFAPAEEEGLARRFGRLWREYEDRVLLPWV